MRLHLRCIASSIVLFATIAACGDNENAGTDTVADIPAASTTVVDPSDGGFCEAMAHLIVLLSPNEVSSPTETEATFIEAAGWFEQANSTAPAAVADDVAAYKAAYDDYVHFLSTVDFNLDAVFSTPEGTQLAIDTSHSLTPAIVQYAIDGCGLSFGDEERSAGE